MLKFNYQLYIGLIIGCLISLLPNNLKLVILLNIMIVGLSFGFLELIIYLYKESLTDSLNILEINYDKNMRCLNITMSNSNMLEGEYLFSAIYNSLINNKEYLNFGFHKIIIVSCVLDNGQEHNLHSNILLDNQSTFFDYWLYISKELNNYINLEYGYHNQTIIRYQVKVWNMDNLNNLKIKQTHNAIQWTKKHINKAANNINTPAWKNHRLFSTSSVQYKHWSVGLISPISLLKQNGKLKLESPKTIFTMDLETINFNNVQIPITISSCGPKNSGILDSKLFIIDYNLLKTNSELAIKQLWNQYFTYLENLDLNINKLTIFAHNLGNFDGYFLYKGLMNHYNPDIISSIIDDSNKFISITCNSTVTIEWKDSLRIFPISLDKLCQLFEVDGKLTPYNPKFNNIDLFKIPKLFNKFKKYSLQDSIALYKALFTAQHLYFSKFGIDIESIYSTSTLALKIFRTKFQEKPIFILPSHFDNFIRNSYYGGGTDVYKAYGKNIHYYDVNSLYPFAM